ncbi:hypothetical protein GO639_03440 [Staphylococcus aureus]|nr:hypothetical protein [Staphylococcus aureus]
MFPLKMGHTVDVVYVEDNKDVLLLLLLLLTSEQTLLPNNRTVTLFSMRVSPNKQASSRDGID